MGNKCSYFFFSAKETVESDHQNNASAPPPIKYTILKEGVTAIEGNERKDAQQDEAQPIIESDDMGSSPDSQKQIHQNINNSDSDDDRCSRSIFKPVTKDSNTVEPSLFIVDNAKAPSSILKPLALGTG